MNRGDETVHLYQVWIIPRSENITPRHEERDFSDIPHDRLVPVASGFDHDALQIHADAVIYRGVFDTDTSWTHMVQAGTGNVFIYVIRGSVDLISGETLEAGDQARISDIEILELNFSPGTDVVVIDLSE